MSLMLLGSAAYPISVFIHGDDIFAEGGGNYIEGGEGYVNNEGLSEIIDYLPYDIKYEGGVNLGEANVKPLFDENSRPADTFEEVITAHTESITLNFEKPHFWSDGYIFDSETNSCRPLKYIKLSSQTHPEDLVVTAETENYNAKVTLKKISVEDFVGDYAVTMGFTQGTLALYTGLPTFANKTTCENTHASEPELIPGTYGLDPGDPSSGKVFIETKIEFSSNNKNDKLLKSDEVFLGLTDIDTAQSFKILNKDSLINAGNMYAKNPNALQPTGTELRNKFVANGNYIYSQYTVGDDSKPTEFIRMDEGNDLYIKLGNKARTEGVSVVYGFVYGAASGINYYARQYTVTYESGDHGTIQGGNTQEKVPAGNSPAGVTTKADSGYTFKHWVADRNVIYSKDDVYKVIKKGEAITAKQIKNLVIRANTKLTAIFGDTDGTDHDSDTPSSDTPSSDTPSSDTPSSDTPSSNTPSSNTPSSNTPSSNTPSSQSSSVKAPNTGSTTKDIDAAYIASLSMTAILSIALFIRILPRITHKKIDFKR